MLANSFRTGVQSIFRRPWLVVLVFVAHLVPAFVLTLPIKAALESALGDSGFGRELAAGFDPVIWADLFEVVGAGLRAVWLQLLWVFPLYLVWKAAYHVGLIHALRGEGIRSFWQGVGRYTGRAVLLSLTFLIPVISWIVATVILGVMLNALWSGEVGTFWIFWVLVPLITVLGLAALDLMHDYARIALVVDGYGVKQAAGTGFGWPFKHGSAIVLYLGWFVFAVLLWFLPGVLDVSFAAASSLSVWGLFLVQQLVFVLRAAVTVGWIGSETAYYEEVRIREAPLIAGDDTEEETSAPEPLDVRQTGWAQA